MKRFVKRILLPVALLAFLCQGAFAADFKLTLAHGGETNHPWQIAALKFKEIVEKESNGRIALTIFTAGEMGGDREMAEALQNGSLDMTIIATMAMSAFEPQVQIFDFPYLFPTEQTAYKVLDGEAGKLVAEYLAKKGFHVLAYWENSYRGFSNSKRKITKPEDLKGLKFRVPETPILMAWLRSIGSAPTPMPFTELYSALQTGVVDGQDNGILLTYTHKVGEVQKYYTLANHIYSPAPLYFNAKKFAKLPKDLQDILAKAAVECRDYQRGINAEYALKYEKALTDMGLEVTTLTPEQLQVFVDSARPLYNEFKGKIDPKIYEAVMAAVSQ